MVNLLHICETMINRSFSEEEIAVPIDVLEKFAEKNNLELRKKIIKNKNRYKIVRRKIPIHYVSGDEENLINFLDISDIHIGNSNFDEQMLRSTLKQAMDMGIKIVFIAGDVFEGVTTDNDVLKIRNDQIEYAYQIFKDYPLKYYVINGNHDYTFEQFDMSNPIKILANRLQNMGINFNFFDTYVMDFIIGGVVKRVMHVERQDFTKKRIFAIEKLKQFEKELGLTVIYEGNEYPVRFFQAGHIHVNVQMYYAKRKIFISQSGSFLKTDEDVDRANFISAKIIDKKVFMC